MSTADQTSDLTAQERSEISALARNYADKRAVCIEAMKYVQSHYRWVSDHHLAEIAALLEMSRTELEAVATFYNLIFRRPVGEHVIFLCDSVSCWIMGRDTIYKHIKQILGVEAGETTKDGQYTLLPIVCLGHCDHAPAMLIDDYLYGDLEVSQIDTLLEAGTG